MLAAAPPDTRIRILEAAVELFSEQGFEGTTLQQIADRLGFSKAALYYYFKCKDDLLEALVTPAITDLERVLDASEALPDTPARRRQFMKEFLDYLLRHRRLIAYISRDLATLAHPALATGNNERRARVEAMLAGDKLAFTDQIRVAMVFGGMQAVIAQYPDADADELRTALLAASGTLLRTRTRARRRPPLTLPAADRSDRSEMGSQIP